MNKNLIIGLIVFIALTGALLLGRSLNAPLTEVKDKIVGNFDLNACHRTNSATTTRFTLAPDEFTGPENGTTSVVCSSVNSDQVDILIQARASSSVANLIFTREFSDNNIDWYQEDCRTVNSNVLVTHGAGPCTNVWNLATGTQAVASEYVRRNLDTQPLATRWIRYNFSVANASTSLHLILISKDLIK